MRQPCALLRVGYYRTNLGVIVILQSEKNRSVSVLWAAYQPLR